MGGMFIMIVKDVKFQVEFNLVKVVGYCLIGYENWVLKNQDFNNDEKDVGDLGVGYIVIVFYEVVFVGQKVLIKGKVDFFKYQYLIKISEIVGIGEMLMVKFCYKVLQGQMSKLMSVVVIDLGAQLDVVFVDFKLVSVVVSYGMFFCDFKYKGNMFWESIIVMVSKVIGEDVNIYCKEFLMLFKKACDFVMKDGDILKIKDSQKLGLSVVG